MVDKRLTVRQQIAQFLKYDPRNKLVITPWVSPHIHTTDIGYELSGLIKEDLESPHLPMMAEDCLHSLITKNTGTDEIMGDYVALTNWGILFEPSLKLNLPSLLDSISKNRILILVNCGQADNDRFYLVNKHYNISIPLGDLHPYLLN